MCGPAAFVGLAEVEHEATTPTNDSIRGAVNFYSRLTPQPCDEGEDGFAECEKFGAMVGEAFRREERLAPSHVSECSPPASARAIFSG